jgi:predicted CoA-binding protein
MRVMIIGASTNREKYGNMAVRAFLRQGHEVFPVNPRADEIEGLKCYPDIADVPGPIDRASLYLPPKLGLDAVRELAARGDVEELWVNPGAESDELIAEAKRLGFDPIQACSIVAIGESPYR